MLATKKGARAVHILSLICSAIFLLSGCGEPGPKALLEGERLIREGKFNDAILHLQEAVQLLPHNEQAWNHLGLAYHHSGQRSKAVENYKRALEINGNLAAARYNLGQLYFEQNRYSAAAGDLTTYVILEPKNGEAWNKLATAQLRHSSQLPTAERSRWINSAKSNFEIALRFQQDPHIYNSLGYIEVLRGRPRDSVRYFNLALQKQPNYPPAILNLAIVHHAYLNDRRAALQRYREFLASQPRSTRFREVEAAARQIEIELNPPPQYVTNLVSQVLTAPRQTAVAPSPAVQPQPAPQPVREVKPEPRVETAATPPPARSEPVSKPKEQSQAEPQPKSQPKPAPAPVTPPAQVEVARVPEEQPIKTARDVPVEKETPVAVPAPVVKPRETQVAETPSEEPEETTGRQRFLQRLNPTTWFRDKTNEPAPPKTEPAPPPAQKTVASTPTPAPRPVTSLPTRPPTPRYRYSSAPAPKPGNRAEAARIFNQALAAQRQRDSVTALELYRKATQIDPGFFEAHYNLGLVALQRKQTGEALEAYETALAISPDSANARYNFAYALQRGNYLLDAANEFEKLIARNPRETRAHLSLANLYAQMPGNRSRARAHYQKVLELEPNHAQATAIRYWLRDNP